MQVVITGASGFVGRHLVEYFLENEAETTVITVSRSSYQQKKNEIHICDDLSDEELLFQKMLNAGVKSPDAFYHFAWSGVSTEYKNAFDVQSKNLKQGLCALSVCSRLGGKKFINLGTVAEYVACDGLINNKSCPYPNDVYGAMKIAAHYLLEVTANALQQDFIYTILASTYGERRTDDNVISYTIKTLLRGETPAYGTLEQMWDFLYIKDAVYALYLIGKYGKAGETYSIGSGQYRHLYEYIKIIRDMIDPTLQLNIGAKKEKYATIRNSCVDLFNLQRDTHFIPRYTFSEGIARTIAYFKEKETLS